MRPPPRKPDEYRIPRRDPPADPEEARAAIKRINRQVELATKGVRKVRSIEFGQQRRIARTVVRRDRRQAPRPKNRPVLRCDVCVKVFSDERLLAEHNSTKKHFNKVWARNRPQCLVCPYIPTSPEDWARHTSGRRHRK